MPWFQDHRDQDDVFEFLIRTDGNPGNWINSARADSSLASSRCADPRDADDEGVINLRL